MAAPTLSFLYLDHARVGDPLFLRALGHALARAVRSGLRPIVIHGTGAYVERVLEGEGIFLDHVGGIAQATVEREREMLRTSMRDLNRHLISTFTEAVVPAVGFLGSDRNLLHARGSEIVAGHTEWVAEIAHRSCVPVIAAMARTEDGGETPVDPAQVLLTLLGAMSSPCEIVVFTKTNLAGVLQGADPLPEIDLSDMLNASVIDDKRAVKLFVTEGHSVLLSNAIRYGDLRQIRGTLVRALQS